MTGFPAKVRDLVTRRSCGWCERCGNNATDLGQLHHRRPRGMGSSRREDTNTASNGLWLCGACHAHIESYREQALEDGYLVRQGHTPAEVPVRLLGVWMLLDDDGGAVVDKAREWAEFQGRKARGFVVPAGIDRCTECGFHEPTQGHRHGCPQQEGQGR